MDGKRIGHMTTTTGVELGGQVLTWVDKSYTPTLAGIGFNSTLFLVINTLLLHILHLVLLLLLSDHLFPHLRMLFALIVTSALFLYINMASALRNVVVVGGSYVGLVSFSLPFPTYFTPSVPTLRQ